MDVFIGTITMLFVFALISGLFVAAGVIGDMKYSHRHAGISLLALSFLQAVVIIVMIANPAIRNAGGSIAEMIQPLFWTASNLIAGIALIALSLRSPRRAQRQVVTPAPLRIARRPSPSL